MPRRLNWFARISTGLAILTVFSIAILVLIFMALGLKAALILKGVEAAETAAWMQAIGAFLAIGAAVLVAFLQTHMQAREAQAREASEIHGLLECLRTETAVLGKNVDERFGIFIENTNPGEGVFLFYPVPAEPFKIYYGLIPKLGMIRERAIRTQIVEAYAEAASFVATIRYNNEAVEHWRQATWAEKRSATKADAEEAQDAFNAVTQYGDGVRQTWRLARDKMRALEQTLASL